MNIVDELAVIPPEVTVILPVAPVPTTAVITLSLTTLNEAAGALPKLTAVAPIKPVPLIVTVDALAALVGEKSVITGDAVLTFIVLL